MKTTTLLPCMIFAMTVLTGEAGPVFAEPEMVQASDSEQEAGPVEFEQVVQFDRDIHFLTPDGQDKVVPSGSYYVDAVDNGLRLKSAENEEAEAVIVQAEMTTHDRSVEAPEAVSMKEGEDHQVVMMLLPDGKAMQAVGSSSGVHPRGFKLALEGLILPTVKAILTVPLFGPVTPGGTLYIKGEHFGSQVGKAKVVLHLSSPLKQQFLLSVKEWTDTKIKAEIPWDISGVMDQPAVFQVLSAKGIGGIGWKVPFYAARQSKVLASNDPAVKVVHCSTGADYNHCNSLDTSTGGSCFASTQKIFKERGAIYARHVNCDAAIDWDDGKDSYAITLKNGWVFTKVQYYQDKSSSSEKINTPDYASLRKSLPGTSSWNPSISWEVSPGPDQLEYAYELTIEGPKGVPHY